jgi:hypothetical protein
MLEHRFFNKLLGILERVPCRKNRSERIAIRTHDHEVLAQTARIGRRGTGPGPGR